MKCTGHLSYTQRRMSWGFKNFLQLIQSPWKSYSNNFLCGVLLSPSLSWPNLGSTNASVNKIKYSNIYDDKNKSHKNPVLFQTSEMSGLL